MIDLFTAIYGAYDPSSQDSVAFARTKLQHMLRKLILSEMRGPGHDECGLINLCRICKYIWYWPEIRRNEDNSSLFTKRLGASADYQWYMWVFSIICASTFYIQWFDFWPSIMLRRVYGCWGSKWIYLIWCADMHTQQWRNSSCFQHPEPRSTKKLCHSLSIGIISSRLARA